VGLGIVPADETTRTYRDALGRVNTRLAANVDRAVFMVAGRALELRDVEDVV
jgi:adenosylcobinamide kinase/adenosylcobinamide-phosphate guanylyltransferase